MTALSAESYSKIYRFPHLWPFSAIFLGHLDYCNAVLAYVLTVPNSTASVRSQLVCNLPKLSHVSNYAEETLLYQPVEGRIAFEVCRLQFLIFTPTFQMIIKRLLKLVS